MSTLTNVSVPSVDLPMALNASSIPLQREWPSPVGLTLGILCVAVGQLAVLVFQYLRVRFGWFTPVHVQTGAKVRVYDYWEGVRTHLAQPEGFGLLVAYLSGTWMFNLMPQSYYSFEGGVNWLQVLQQLLIQVRFQLRLSFYRFCHLCCSEGEWGRRVGLEVVKFVECRGANAFPVILPSHSCARRTLCRR
jgi:hypothetical protein